MKNIMYHQISMTNKPGESENLMDLQEQGYFILGVEITDPDLASLCHLSIDPQHTITQKSSITSIEYTFNYQEDILKIIDSFEKLLLVTIKPDVDSIGTMAIITMLINKKFFVDGDIILRLKAIAKSDRHGRQNWRKRKEDYFRFDNYNVYGLPSGLAYMTSDHKLSTKIKVDNMINYLIEGTFDGLEKYNDLVVKNLKKSNKSTVINVLIPKKLCFVTSHHRGAISVGYRHCPVVIAKNEKFIFGKLPNKIIGTKWTIAQYDDGDYINMDELKNQLSKLEPGFGGSNIIIGSPQDRASILTDDIVIGLTKKCLY
jgi:hypothetical protein